MTRAAALGVCAVVAVLAVGCPRSGGSAGTSSAASPDVQAALAEAHDDDERAALEEARAEIDAARRAELAAKNAELAQLKAENEALRRRLAEKP